MKYIEYITYGADCGILSYNYSNDKYSGAHAVVCYGMELAKYADTSSWRKNIGFDPDARILIYDVNETIRDTDLKNG